jgi:hypothetical protein
MPQCPYTSAYPHMLERCYKTDRVFSCYANGRKYSIGNLTTNSYWGYADPVCPMVTGHPDLSAGCLTQMNGLKVSLNTIGLMT